MGKGLSNLQETILKTAWFFCDTSDDSDILIADILLMINPEFIQILKDKETYINGWKIRETDHFFSSVAKRDPKTLKILTDAPEAISYFELKSLTYSKKTYFSDELRKARVIANKSLNGLKKRRLIDFERINPISDNLKLPDSEYRNMMMSLNSMELFHLMLERKEDNIKKRSHSIIRLTDKGLVYCKEKYGLYTFGQTWYESLLNDDMRRTE